MELDARYDGVAGRRGAGARRTSLGLPGDSFTTAFTPPRAGTYDLTWTPQRVMERRGTADE
jgi:hypothetical protein